MFIKTAFKKEAQVNADSTIITHLFLLSHPYSVEYPVEVPENLKMMAALVEFVDFVLAVLVVLAAAAAAAVVVVVAVKVIVVAAVAVAVVVTFSFSL